MSCWTQNICKVSALGPDQNNEWSGKDDFESILLRSDKAFFTLTMGDFQRITFKSAQFKEQF